MVRRFRGLFAAAFGGSRPGARSTAGGPNLAASNNAPVLRPPHQQMWVATGGTASPRSVVPILDDHRVVRLLAIDGRELQGSERDAWIAVNRQQLDDWLAAHAKHLDAELLNSVAKRLSGTAETMALEAAELPPAFRLTPPPRPLGTGRPARPSETWRQRVIDHQRVRAEWCTAELRRLQQCRGVWQSFLAAEHEAAAERDRERAQAAGSAAVTERRLCSRLKAVPAMQDIKLAVQWPRPGVALALTITFTDLSALPDQGFDYRPGELKIETRPRNEAELGRLGRAWIAFAVIRLIDAAFREFGALEQLTVQAMRNLDGRNRVPMLHAGVGRPEWLLDIQRASTAFSFDDPVVFSWLVWDSPQSEPPTPRRRNR